MGEKVGVARAGARDSRALARATVIPVRELAPSRPVARSPSYDEARQPLPAAGVYEDIVEEYRNRTVTIDPHPHMAVSTPHASIHPCRHASVMKRIVDNMKDGGRTPDLTQYIVIFLKFVQSVVPTIDYDFTMEVRASTVR